MSFGMKDEHRQLLRRHRAEMAKVLETDKVVENLIVDNTIDEEDEQNIKGKPTKIAKARELVDIICRKGPNAFKRFVEACEKPHPELAKKLKEEGWLEHKVHAQQEVDATDSAIHKVCNELTVSECKNLSRKLRLTQDEIDGIGQTYPRDAEMQKESMLYLWKKKCPYKPSMHVNELYHKLVELELKNVAENLKPFLSAGSSASDDLASGLEKVSITTKIRPSQPAVPPRTTFTASQLQCTAKAPSTSLPSNTSTLFSEEEFTEALENLDPLNQDQCKVLGYTLKEGEISCEVLEYMKFWETQMQMTAYRLVCKLRKFERMDVVKVLRKYLPSGTTGPRRPRNMHIKSLDYGELDDFCRCLSVRQPNGMDWRTFAANLGIGKTLIDLWDQQENKLPMHKLMSICETQSDATIGKFYDVLVKMDLPHIADEYL